MKNITEILTSGQWRGHECFIIGGGTSILNFNFKAIENRFTIGINKSFTNFNTTICYAMDPKFYNYIVCKDEEKENIGIKEKWKNYQGIKIFLSTAMDSGKTLLDKNTYFVNRIYEKKVSFDLVKGIYGGFNSGIGALMLACCLGVNTVYLCGFDMKINSQKTRTHWHTGYPKQNMEMFEHVLEKYKKEFYEFAPILRQLNIKIININTENRTALKCFPIKKLDEIV